MSVKFCLESETRRRVFVDGELRALNGSKITGHAAVFNELSEDLGGFREKIAPGAFADTIQDGDVRALWNHDTNFVLGRTKANTLRLSEDDIGLATEYDFPDTSFARDLLTLIRRGDVSQQSFGFMVLPDGEKWRLEEGGLIRILTKVELFDVSPVTFPAYPQTDVKARAELRSLAEKKLRELSAAASSVEGAAVAAVAVAAAVADAALPYDKVLEHARVTNPDKEREEFLKRVAQRKAFIDQRTPQPDPLSYSEIIKRAAARQRLLT